MFTATETLPFGLPIDPTEIKSNNLSSNYNLILSTIYSLSNKIFINDENTNLINLWNSNGKKNFNDVLPNVENFENLPDFGNLLLGYLKNSTNENITLLTNTDSLINFSLNLINQPNNQFEKLPLSIQLSSISYDFNSNSYISNFNDVIEISKNLKLPLLISSNDFEYQIFSIISIVLSKLNINNIHLFNGFETNITKSINNLLNSNEINKFQNNLLNDLKSSILNINPLNIISFTLEKVNSILGTSFKNFQFFGNSNASIVNILYPNNEKINSIINENKSDEAFIIVKSPVPFDSSLFNSLINSNIKQINVIDNSLLKLDIKASLFFNGLFSINIIEQSLNDFITKYTANVTNSVKKYKFLFNDNSKFIELPSKLTHAFSLIQDENIKFESIYDNSINAGLFEVNLTIGKGIDIIEKFDFILIEDINILNSINLIEILNNNGELLIINEESTFDEDKIIDKKISNKVKKILSDKKINLKFLDLNSINEVNETNGRTKSIAIQSAIWSLNYPNWDKHSVVTKILQFFGSEAELLASVIADQVENIKSNGFKIINVKEDWAKLEIEEDEEPFTVTRPTSFKPNPRELFIDNETIKVEANEELAKKLIFKEAYGTEKSLRPDQPCENFIVKVKENKRLTPDDYNRNIFHIEFDIGTTGLKYNIGEALGIHGRNNVELVDEFIKMYGNGITGNELIEVVSRDNNQIFEIRTLRQSLIDNLDLFGKPGKKFYESLIEFATNEEEKKLLEKIISPSGGEIFKKYQEVEFYTFADIFEIFPSVRPNAQELVSIINPLKRREYSIASSQKLHPNEVHLLIVVVDWIDNKGRKRFGQCSKYLSDLKIGDELVVSVKPSIMKLPPLTKQPIIMAGLGTGLAPFKAFIEERQYQLQQGNEIGEIYLYLGSRHKRQEYLYGEYWENYMDAKILTHLGAAFSRDQINKIYIQDKIRENLEELKELIVKKDGYFYLCGPTWPVPDISACLQDVLKSDAKDRGVKIDAAKAVEEMKEDGKYVLEVY